MLYAQYLSTSFIYLFVIAIRVKDKYLKSSKPSYVLRSKVIMLRIYIELCLIIYFINTKGIIVIECKLG